MAAEQVAEQAVEQIAEGFEGAAKVTRSIDVRSVGFLLGGLGAGLAIGFYFGHRWNKEKIKAEAFRESEAEVQKIREVYRHREILEQQERAQNQKKPGLDEIIEERGYSTAVEEGAENRGNLQPRPLPPPVPVTEPTATNYSHSAGTASRFVKRTADAEKDKNDGWSYPYELSRRSSDTPHIIHQDEWASNESGYSQVSYIYYEGDDVLTEEDDSIIHNRENLVGSNLRFGHGTDDMNLVYIRNSALEIEFEICRTPKSYSQEVLGLAPNDNET